MEVSEEAVEAVVVDEDSVVVVVVEDLGVAAEEEVASEEVGDGEGFRTCIFMIAGVMSVSVIPRFQYIDSVESGNNMENSYRHEWMIVWENWM